MLHVASSFVFWYIRIEVSFFLSAKPNPVIVEGTVLFISTGGQIGFFVEITSIAALANFVEK
jgi:hypothetical protein